MNTMSGPNRSISIEPTTVIELLRVWLSRAISPEGAAWLDAEIERQGKAYDERRVPMALGLAGRKVGRNDLGLTVDDIAAAQKMRSEWQPQTWGTDEAARVAIVLSTYHGDDAEFAARVDRLCTTAEINEYVAYLKGFAVFPAPRELYSRAREGVRSSISSVFEAIAGHNPYPFDYFDEAAWNQMVVKCVFIGMSLDGVVGLRERRNPEVIQMLRDLVAERRAAGRTLPDAVYTYIDGD